MSDDNCLFCSIVSGSKSAVIVDQNEASLTFLDYRPLFPGHCLVVPRQHYETLSDLPDAEVGPFFQRVQMISRAVKCGMDAEGTFVAMNNHVSQSVPHLHVHVVPRRRKDGLKEFFWPRTKYDSDQQAAEIAARLRAGIGG